MQTQMTLFDDLTEAPVIANSSRSGTFVDNMSLPVHRWYRYSAGFAAQWVEQVLADWGISGGQIVLDPFAGSGTVPLVCDSLGIASIGVEAHPIVARICRAKLMWTSSIERLAAFAERVLHGAKTGNIVVTDWPDLIQRSFDREALRALAGLKASWQSAQDGSPESELVWLAITAILRPASNVGTAPWQYILPNKTKKNTVVPLAAFHRQVDDICADMQWMQSRTGETHAEIHQGDARSLASLGGKTVDAVITSPPYANNYDYADALRFEMTFWGDVQGWGGVHDLVRRHLIVSSSQHASRERLDMDDTLRSGLLDPIRGELTSVVHELAKVRGEHGGKKHYHTMVAAYCRDIATVIRALRTVCKPGARMCWVIGDSAPYGVYCPIEKWIAELAMAAEFKSYRFEKLRDRNIKWKNRKHRVPLKEGLLWIEG